MAEEEAQVLHAAEAAGIADKGTEAAPADQADTPTTFLNNLTETLKGTEGVDADLAGVLTDHLLMAAPHANAVANARAAIVELAGQRAAPAATDEAEAASG